MLTNRFYPTTSRALVQEESVKFAPVNIESMFGDRRVYTGAGHNFVRILPKFVLL